MGVTKNRKFIYYKALQQNVAVDPTIFQPKQNLMKKNDFLYYELLESGYTVIALMIQ